MSEPLPARKPAAGIRHDPSQYRRGACGSKWNRWINLKDLAEGGRIELLWLSATLWVSGPVAAHAAAPSADKVGRGGTIRTCIAWFPKPVGCRYPTPRNLKAGGHGENRTRNSGVRNRCVPNYSHAPKGKNERIVRIRIFLEFGAGGDSRNPTLRFTGPLLFHLSYTGKSKRPPVFIRRPLRN